MEDSKRIEQSRNTSYYSGQVEKRHGMQYIEEPYLHGVLFNTPPGKGEEL